MKQKKSNSRENWNTIIRLIKYMKKSSLFFGVAVILAIAGTVMQVYSPKLLGDATTTIFNGIKSGSGIDFNRLGVLLFIVAALYAGVCLTSFLQQRLMVVVSQKTVYTLRNELKAKMNQVPVSFFDKNSNGNLMSVAINDVDNIMTNLQQSLIDLLAGSVLVIGFFCMMLSISPLLTVLSCIMVPGSLIVMKLFTKRTQKQNRTYFSQLGELNGQIEETYQGFSVIKSFNSEGRALDDFKAVNTKMYESGWKAKFLGGNMMPCMTLVQNIVYILIAVVGAVNVISGAVVIGDMQAFLQYSTQFSQPLLQFSQTWNSILSMLASVRRVFDLLDAEEMAGYESAFPNESGSNAKIVFDCVNFSYTEKPLMRGFSLSVQNGQTVAIVGHTGAGKTTLINLLERFYEIQGGSIRIDGTDIRNLDRQALRRRTGMVLQDTWLFSGTIYDNIRFGNDNASEEQVYAAAKAAFADDFIRKLPDGYNTVLDEEAGNISQGQRQLITIARAFLRNPEILILDEATSNVDSRTEWIIQSAMKKLLKGRTSFVVAHRLSTIYDADQIIVMDKGNIVETGTHKQLLALNGTYADIYNSQFAQISA